MSVYNDLYQPLRSGSAPLEVVMVSPNESLIAGSVSGGTCRLLTAPLDVLKVRLQLQIEPISKVSKELVDNASRFLMLIVIARNKTCFLPLSEGSIFEIS